MWKKYFIKSLNADIIARIGVTDCKGITDCHTAPPFAMTNLYVITRSVNDEVIRSLFGITDCFAFARNDIPDGRWQISDIRQTYVITQHIQPPFPPFVITQHIRLPPVADKRSICWRRGRNFTTLQGVKNFGNHKSRERYPSTKLRLVPRLACRLGRCFCFAEVSTGDPHPLGQGRLRRSNPFSLWYYGL